MKLRPLSPTAQSFVPKEQVVQVQKDYFRDIMPQLVKDTFMVSIYRARDNKLYFDDIYLGIPIEITEDQYNSLSTGGKNAILEFATMYNEEHVIPASIYDRKEPIVNDLHNVLPVITFLNEQRSNLDIRQLKPNENPTDTYCYDYTNNKIVRVEGQEIIDKPGCVNMDVSQADRTYYNKRNELYDKEYTTFSCLFGNCTFQPANTEYLGLIARTVLYFHSKYANHEHVNKKLYQDYMPADRIGLMHYWNNIYPPTYYEFQRHAHIVKKTGVSNKYFEEKMEQMYGTNWKVESGYIQLFN
jgi:endonuclease I